MSARDDYPDLAAAADGGPSDERAALDEIDRLRALAVELWDEVMAWHLDDCLFPDSPMGTMDDQCICHSDLLAKFIGLGAPSRWWHET